MGLTDLQVKKLKPKLKLYEMADGKGLYIRVMPSGSKHWGFRYQFDGRARRTTLGNYPGVTLAQARERHGAALMSLQRGVDPGEVALLAKAKRKAAPTFRDMLDEFWNAELRKKKSGKATRRLLEKDTIPAWGGRKVEDIKKREIVLLLDKIEKRAPIVRNRVHGALSRFFNFSAERGVIDDSPCTRIKKITERGRKRVLTDDEIKLLWEALDLENMDIDIYRVSKLALKLILLTGQRPGEVCGMAWAELDDDGFWNIPEERMKNGDPHRVPICSMAQEVIEEARGYSGENDYVFASSYKLGRPMTRHAVSRAVARHWEDMGIEEKFTPHDLRRTLRTRLADIHVTDIVAERVLGHKLQGMLAVYNQHSYDSEKRDALTRWEQEICKILGLTRAVDEVENVVNFDEVRHA